MIAVTLRGNSNTVILGNGNDTVSVDGTGNSITVGSGHDAITVGSNAGNNTFMLDGSTSSLSLQGSNNMVFISGGRDAIVDSSGSADNLLLEVGALGGSITISDFSAAKGMVDFAMVLANSQSWTTPSQIVSALTSDRHGGSLLSLGSHGSIDLSGVAPTALHAANFQIG